MMRAMASDGFPRRHAGGEIGAPATVSPAFLHNLGLNLSRVRLTLRAFSAHLRQ
jgi:hypothetical protein